MSRHNFLLRLLIFFWFCFCFGGSFGGELSPPGRACVSKSNTLTCTSKLILDVSGRSYFSVKQNSVSQTAQRHTDNLLILKKDFFGEGHIVK